MFGVAKEEKKVEKRGRRYEKNVCYCISDSFWEHHLLMFDVTIDLRLLRKTGGCVLLCMGV